MFFRGPAHSPVGLSPGFEIPGYPVPGTRESKYSAGSGSTFPYPGNFGTRVPGYPGTRVLGLFDTRRPKTQHSTQHTAHRIEGGPAGHRAWGHRIRCPGQLPSVELFLAVLYVVFFAAGVIKRHGTTPAVELYVVRSTFNGWVWEGGRRTTQRP